MFLLQGANSVMSKNFNMADLNVLKGNVAACSYEFFGHCPQRLLVSILAQPGGRDSLINALAEKIKTEPNSIENKKQIAHMMLENIEYVLAQDQKGVPSSVLFQPLEKQDLQMFLKICKEYKLTSQQQQSEHFNDWMVLCFGSCVSPVFSTDKLNSDRSGLPVALWKTAYSAVQNKENSVYKHLAYRAGLTEQDDSSESTRARIQTAEKQEPEDAIVQASLSATSWNSRKKEDIQAALILLIGDYRRAPSAAQLQAMQTQMAVLCRSHAQFNPRLLLERMNDPQLTMVLLPVLFDSSFGVGLKAEHFEFIYEQIRDVPELRATFIELANQKLSPENKAVAVAQLCQGITLQDKEDLILALASSVSIEDRAAFARAFCQQMLSKDKFAMLDNANVANPKRFVEQMLKLLSDELDKEPMKQITGTYKEIDPLPGDLLTLGKQVRSFDSFIDPAVETRIRKHPEKITDATWTDLLASGRNGAHADLAQQQFLRKELGADLTSCVTSALMDSCSSDFLSGKILDLYLTEDKQLDREKRKLFISAMMINLANILPPNVFKSVGESLLKQINTNREYERFRYLSVQLLAQYRKECFISDLTGQPKAWAVMSPGVQNIVLNTRVLPKDGALPKNTTLSKSSENFQLFKANLQIFLSHLTQDQKLKVLKQVSELLKSKNLLDAKVRQFLTEEAKRNGVDESVIAPLALNKKTVVSMRRSAKA